MNDFKRWVYFLMSLIAFSSQGIAATDPIKWSLDQSFPETVYTGHTYTVTYTFTNEIPFQLVKPLQISKSASPSTEFSYTDHCSGVKLAYKQSCTVEVQLDVFVAGMKFVQLTIEGYSDDHVPLPLLTTTADSSSTGAVVGTPTLRLPGSMSANTSANYTFLFTNNSPIDATDLHVSVTQTTGTPDYTTTCVTKLGRNGGTCTVTGQFTPTANTPARQIVIASLSFSGPQNSPAITSTYTTINTPVEGGPILGSVVPGDSLPPLMTPNQEVTGVQFLFTNTSTTGYTFTNAPTVALTWSSDGQHFATCDADSSPACTSIVNNCISNLGASPAACNVTLNFTAPSSASSPPLTYTLKASLGYNSNLSPATVTTSGAVVSTLPTERTIKMVNLCDFKVSYSLNGASAPCTPGVTVPGVDGGCFWQNYSGQSNLLAANTGVDYVTIPANDIGGIQWSGNISAMTGCADNGTCTQAICGSTGSLTWQGNCAPGKGFNQPATQAEITMLTNSGDNYDTEVINGFHIPISMKPYYYLDKINSANDIPATPDNFLCGTAGRFDGGNGFGPCDWGSATLSEITVNPAYFYFVGGGSGNDCLHCLSGEICGLAQTVPNSTITGPVCGNFKGYWTPNELCTQQSNLPDSVKAGLSCTTSLPSDFNLLTDPYNNTYTSLMACHVATGYTGPIYNSCYTPSYSSPGTPDQCCGCVDWWETSQTTGGVSIGANQTSQTCPITHVDSYWTSNIQPNIQWLKKACPSSYVYPFDDASSKFTCTNGTQSGANSTSYVITFCSGNSGLPAGANEGRG